MEYILQNLLIFVIGIWVVNKIVKWLQEPKDNEKTEILRAKLNDALQNGITRQEPNNTRCGTGKI